MELANANARYEALHKDAPYHDGNFESWAKERSVEHPFHYNDGVRIWVSDVDYDPDGSWLSGGEKSQEGPEGDESN